MKPCLFPPAKRSFFRFTAVFIFSSFLVNTLIPSSVFSQEFFPSLQIINPNININAATQYMPALIKGLSVYPDNPLEFDFIVDPGDSNLRGEALNQETLKMVKYFLASLTIPDNQMWVNLSPDEPKRIMSGSLGSTSLGRDLLAQDYLLKQVAASMTYPENEIGKNFWQKIYRLAYERFGTTEVPTDIFSKVWIVPNKAAVYEKDRSVFVVTRDLKVMLDQDYRGLKKGAGPKEPGEHQLGTNEKVSQVTSKILREIIVPELQKEVIYGKYFANLRQIYNAMILAKWFKENLRDSLFSKVYVNQEKIKGVDIRDPQMKEKIYKKYLEVFQKGIYDFIKEEYDPTTKELLPRKYFSGGLVGFQDVPVDRVDFSQLTKNQKEMLDGSDEAPFVYTIDMFEVGPRAENIGWTDVPRMHLSGVNDVPFSGITPLQEDFIELIDPIRKAPQIIVDVGEEYTLSPLGVFSSVQGAGGMGFLSGEFNAGLKNMVRSGAFSITPAYKNYKAINMGEWEKTDWKNMPGVQPLLIQKEDGSEEILRFPVSFKGAYNGHPLGEDYEVEVYFVNNNGNLTFLWDVPEEPNLFHHLYDNFNNDEKRWIQFGLEARVLVEFCKRLGVAPDVLRLNEGHMSFVYPAIRNDIEFHRVLGEHSIFEGIKIIFTNHTPELAGIPQTGDIEILRERAGEDLVPDYMLTDGYYNSLWAIVQNALKQDEEDTGIKMIINGVSKEHEEIILKVLLKRFPEAYKVVTHVQNSSKMEEWISDLLKKAIEEHGIEGVTGEMLLNIAEEHKQHLNQDLREMYGENAPQFNEELLKKRPILGFLRRWVEYKEAGILLPLLKWITGDGDKIYKHPEIPDLDVLNDPDRLEAFLQNPKWVEGPGLEMLVLAGGKAQGEPKGEEWLKTFKDLTNDPEIKGKMIVIEDTGFPIMRLATWASTFLYNVPDPTREASGTSQQRSGFMGRLIIAVLRAGMSAQIVDKVTGWLVNAFPQKTQDELLEDFNPENPRRIQKARNEFRKRVPVLVSAYLQEAANLYYHNREELAQRMLIAFRTAVDTVDMPRMVREYEALAISMQNGTGKTGFEDIREKMYIQDLFANIARWHPEVKRQGKNLQEIRALIKEFWSPLDNLILGPGALNDLLTQSDKDFISLIENNQFQRVGETQWILNDGGTSQYLDNAQVTGLSLGPAQKKKVGGIDFDPNLLDLQIKRDSAGVPLPLPDQPVDSMKIQGFYPVIIHVAPVSHMPFLLGKSLHDAENFSDKQLFSSIK